MDEKRRKGVGYDPTPFRAMKSGGVLLSQGISPQVPSALTGLTSVFGMGTGVTLSLWPPKLVVKRVCTRGLQSKHELS